MNILESADTWFFDDASFNLDGVLVIEIVEGIRAVEKELVEISDKDSLGPYYPVRVTEKSRVVSVSFPKTLSYSITNESYDIGDDRIEKTSKYLFECAKSRYLDYIKNSTSILSQVENYKHYFLWTEDYMIDVIGTEKPDVQVLTRSPNVTVERTIIYDAKQT